MMRSLPLLLALAGCADKAGDSGDAGSDDTPGGGDDTAADTGDSGQPVQNDVIRSGDIVCNVPSEDDIRAIDPSTLPAGPSPCREPVLAHVDWTTDGDTFDVTVEGSGDWETIRVIGIDTPETYGEVECYGPESSDFSEDALTDRLVWLTFDYDCIDPYDRTLAYVHLGADDACFFERLALRGGYAETLTFDATDTWADTFREDQLWAAEHGEGMWAECEQ